MASATKAYAALREAMRDTVPSCLGDDRFTSETADPAPLIEICAGCPLIDPCGDLANINNPIPVFGVLAGRVRRGNRLQRPDEREGHGSARGVPEPSFSEVRKR